MRMERPPSCTMNMQVGTAVQRAHTLNQPPSSTLRTLATLELGKMRQWQAALPPWPMGSSPLLLDGHEQSVPHPHHSLLDRGDFSVDREPPLTAVAPVPALR